MPRKVDGADYRRKLLKLYDIRHAVILRAGIIFGLDPNREADRKFLLGVLAEVFSDKHRPALKADPKKAGRPKGTSLPLRYRRVMIAAGDLYLAGMNIDQALNKAVKAAVKSGALTAGDERSDKRRLKRKWDELFVGQK